MKSYTMIDEVFDFAVAEELLLDLNPEITKEQIDFVWSLCEGNPWNAPTLYKLLTLKGK
jgi:hypothetical protein